MPQFITIIFVNIWHLKQFLFVHILRTLFFIFIFLWTILPSSTFVIAAFLFPPVNIRLYILFLLLLNLRSLFEYVFWISFFVAWTLLIRQKYHVNWFGGDDANSGFYTSTRKKNKRISFTNNFKYENSLFENGMFVTFMYSISMNHF